MIRHHPSLMCLFVLLFLCEPVFSQQPTTLTVSDPTPLPLIVAHRGASKQAPENTLPAFELAWKQGADAIEGDFRLTKDNEIVCVHDADTKRVADQNMVVSHSTLADLKKLDVGSFKAERFANTRIPTIAEVFATIPSGKKIYIEIKSGVEIAPSMIEAIQNSHLQPSQIVIICFQEKVIQELKRQAPQYEANWLCKVDKKDDQRIPSQQTILETLKKCNADGLGTDQAHVDGAFIQTVQENGYKYHVWTVNDIRVGKRFVEWGTRSITTDIPGALRAALLEKKTSIDERNAQVLENNKSG